MLTHNYQYEFPKVGAKEKFLINLEGPAPAPMSNIGVIKAAKEEDKRDTEDLLKQVEVAKGKKARNETLTQDDQSLLDSESGLRENLKKLEELITYLDEQEKAINASVEEVNKKITTAVENAPENERAGLQAKLDNALKTVLAEKNAQLGALEEEGAIRLVLDSTINTLNSFENENEEFKEALAAIAMFLENRKKVAGILAQYQSYGEGSREWENINKALCMAVLTAEERQKLIDPATGEVTPAQQEAFNTRLSQFQDQIRAMQGSMGIARDGKVGPQTMTAIYEMIGVTNADATGFETVGFGNQTERREASNEDYGRITQVAAAGVAEPTRVEEYTEEYYAQQTNRLRDQIAKLNLDTRGWGEGVQSRNTWMIVNAIITECKTKKIPVPQNIEGLKVWDSVNEEYITLSQGANLNHGRGMMEGHNLEQEERDAGRFAVNVIQTANFNERHPELANRGFYEDEQGFMHAGGRWENGRGQVAANGDVYWEQDGVVYKFDQVARRHWPDIRFTRTDIVPNTTNLAQLNIRPRAA